jgi:hypothetical protein
MGHRVSSEAVRLLELPDPDQQKMLIPKQGWAFFVVLDIRYLGAGPFLERPNVQLYTARHWLTLCVLRGST